MAKKFKKSGLTETLINVGTGGAANALVDVAVEYVAPNTSDMYVNIGKLVGGVVLGSTMGSNKMMRAAADGVATVGAANLVKSLISDGFGSNEGTAGFKRDVIGRMRAGHSRLARRVKRGKVGNAGGNIIG